MSNQGEHMQKNLADFPSIVAQWDWEENTQTPSEVLWKSNKTYFFICEKAHNYKSTASNMTRVGLHGCPYCHGKKVLKGFNDLATTHPLLAATLNIEKTGATAEDFTAGSSKIGFWDCDKGHSWKTAIKARAIQGKNCPYCTNRILLPKDNSLLAVFPEIAKEFDEEKNGIKADEIFAKSGFEVYWKCPKNHSYRARPSDRYYKGSSCPKCSNNGTSKSEQELATFIINAMGPEKVKVNTRKIIAPYEIDVFIPSLKIGFEFNGLYWHSEARVGKDLHCVKANLAKAKQVQLYTIWQDDWEFNKEKCQKFILRKLGKSTETSYNARKCVVKTLKGRQVREFLDKTHLQGFAAGTTYLGLTSEENLVAVAVFNASSNGTHTLTRYASSGLVRGGFGKILSAYEKTLPSGNRLRTFADREVSTGDLYYKLGWTLVGELPPDYKYVYLKNRHHKFNFRKARFKRDPNLKFEVGKTERELAELNGVWRVWGAGKLIFEKTVL